MLNSIEGIVMTIDYMIMKSLESPKGHTISNP